MRPATAPSTYREPIPAREWTPAPVVGHRSLPQKIEGLTNRQVCEMLGIAEASFYRHFRNDPTFPLPVEVRPGINRYLSDEVTLWLRSRPRVQPQSVGSE
jgi:predicted DNA-binding transcriptional regulator AlpA